jgi:hypothetical protein
LEIHRARESENASGWIYEEGVYTCRGMVVKKSHLLEG